MSTQGPPSHRADVTQLTRERLSPALRSVSPFRHFLTIREKSINLFDMPERLDRSVILKTPDSVIIFRLLCDNLLQLQSTFSVVKNRKQWKFDIILMASYHSHF